MRDPEGRQDIAIGRGDVVRLDRIPMFGHDLQHIFANIRVVPSSATQCKSERQEKCLHFGDLTVKENVP